MPKGHCASDSVLLTANIHLTDTDGKSFRFLKLADLFQVAGFRVNMIISKNSSTAARQFSIIETKTDLKIAPSDALPEKLFHHFRQFVKLASFYAKLLVLRQNCRIVISSITGPEIEPLLACMLSKLKRISFVYDYDDPTPEILGATMGWGRQNLFRKIELQVERFLCASSKMTFVPNQTLKSLLSRSVNPSKLVVFYNTVSRFTGFQFSSKGEMADVDLPRNKMIVSYIGLIKPKSYGLEDFLRLFSQIDPNLRRQVLILLIGPSASWIGEDRTVTDIILELGLQANVWYLGLVDRSNARALLRASSLSLILAPKWDRDAKIPPMSTKFFEAMSLGVPLLVPRHPEISQVLGIHYSYYYDFTTNDLEYAIRSALTNKEELKACGEELRRTFEDSFSWEYQRERLLCFLSHAHLVRAATPSVSRRRIRLAES